MPPFRRLLMPRFDRLARQLARRHPEFAALNRAALAILGEDPLNRTQQHSLKKLQGVGPGGGQYRLRLRRFRFRYDVYRDEVVLRYRSLRREDTYR